MKRFRDFVKDTDNDLHESRMLKTASVLTFAKSAKQHGDEAESAFNKAKRRVDNASNNSVEDQLAAIQQGIGHLSDGLVSLRKQNGDITAIVTTSAILSSKTNHQLMSALKRKRS